MSEPRVRAYLPLTTEGLAELERSGVCGPAPLRVHAVTAAVREALPDSDDEELEYAALTAAAQHSVDLPSDRPRRVVVALDVGAVEDLGDPGDPTAAVVSHEVPRRRVAAAQVDTEEAEEAVAAARAARGTPAYDELLERCLDHELAWFATQEIAGLLDP